MVQQGGLPSARPREQPCCHRAALQWHLILLPPVEHLLYLVCHPPMASKDPTWRIFPLSQQLPFMGSRQPSLCLCSYPQGAGRTLGGAPRSCGKIIYFLPGQGTLPYGATAAPKEEGQQLQGLFSSQDAVILPAAVEECPRSCQNQVWTSSWDMHQPFKSSWLPKSNYQTVNIIRE